PEPSCGRVFLDALLIEYKLIISYGFLRYSGGGRAMRLFPVALYAGTAASILLQLPPATAATEKVLYSFCSQQNCTDGEYPWAGVVRVKNTLFATTTAGGGNESSAGTLNSINILTGAANVVYSF